jgi:hypothetical protein
MKAKQKLLGEPVQSFKLIPSYDSVIHSFKGNLKSETNTNLRYSKQTPSYWVSQFKAYTKL